jgi:hypothetical protein
VLLCVQDAVAKEGGGEQAERAFLQDLNSSVRNLLLQLRQLSHLLAPVHFIENEFKFINELLVFGLKK